MMSLSQIADLLRRYWILLPAILAILIVVGFLTGGLIFQSLGEFTPKVSRPLAGLTEGNQVAFPALTDGGKSMVYLSDQGSKFYRYEPQTSKVSPLTSPKFASIQQVVWSPDRGRVLMAVTNNLTFFQRIGSPLYDPKANGLQSWWFFDFGTQKLARLPDRIQEVTWVAGGSKIIFSQFLADAPGITVWLADPDGGAAEKLFDAGGLDAVHITAENLAGANLIYYPEIEAPAQSSLFLHNYVSKQTKELNANPKGSASHVRVSPSGTKVIFDETDVAANSKIYLLDLGSNQIKDLTLSGQTAVSAWDSAETKVYLATTASAAGDQSIWIVDLNQGTNQEISRLPSESRRGISDLLVFGKTAYYVGNGTLYSFELP